MSNIVHVHLMTHVLSYLIHPMHVRVTSHQSYLCVLFLLIKVDQSCLCGKVHMLV